MGRKLWLSKALSSDRNVRWATANRAAIGCPKRQKRRLDRPLIAVDIAPINWINLDRRQILIAGRDRKNTLRDFF
jgi:hypothetical protein